MPVATERLMRVFPVRGPLYEYGGHETVEPLLPRPEGHYRRPVIIDGANVVLCTSEKKTIDALLALMRVLVRHNFEVIVVLPEYLLKPYVIRHGWEQLEILVDLGVISPCSDEANDDLLCFRIARQTGGVVVSRDQFRDLMDIGGPYRRLVHSYSCRTYFVPARESHMMTQDGHYIAHHSFRFDNREGLFFSRPKDRHLIPVLYSRYKQRRSNWAATKAKVLAALDTAILVCFIAERRNSMFTKIPSKEQKEQYLEANKRRQEQFARKKALLEKAKRKDEAREAEKMETEIEPWWGVEMARLDAMSTLKREKDAQGNILIVDPLNLFTHEQQRAKRNQRGQHFRGQEKLFSDEDSSVPEGMLRPDYTKIDYVFDDFECYLDPKNAIVPIAQKFASLKIARA